MKKVQYEGKLLMLNNIPVDAKGGHLDIIIKVPELRNYKDQMKTLKGVMEVTKQQTELLQAKKVRITIEAVEQESCSCAICKWAEARQI